MPGPLATTDELGDPAVTLDQEVCRQPKTAKQRQERMGAGLGLVAEQPLDASAAEITGRQADVVHDQQFGRHAGGPCVAVRASYLPEAVDPAVGPDPQRLHSGYFRPSRCMR